jgi:hypothetical protein
MVVVVASAFVTSNIIDVGRLWSWQENASAKLERGQPYGLGANL